MARIVLVIAALALATVEGIPSGRIVGGANAEKAQFPYIVSIRSFGNHKCGGAIVSKNAILTVAHCVDGALINLMTVTSGTTYLNKGGVTYKIAKAIKHPKFDRKTKENDIAIIKTSEDFFVNEFVQSIDIETENIDQDRDAVFCGWGFTSFPGSSPNDLKYVHLPTISNGKCKTLNEGAEWPVAKTHICTLAKIGLGVCSGDSGGPLTSRNKLIGVVSWGTPCAKGMPDVFTRVSSYVSWIQENL